MYLRLILFLLICWQQSNAQLPAGGWHAAIKLNDTLELPFTFTSHGDTIIIHNGDERILVNEIFFRNDSVFIRMPVFDSEFRCKMEENRLTGLFLNHARKTDNRFTFEATRGLSYRFTDRPERTNANLTGRYRVVFESGDSISKNAIGLFNQDGNRLTATFLTIAGDYRFLEGEIGGNRLWLSAFDGSHLFLFTAVVKDDSLIQGEFFSGKHWHETWLGCKDSSASIIHPDSLTKLKAGSAPLNFSLPDEWGNFHSLSDEKYKNKPAIIQIMGTWCPNCMDESQFLTNWLKENKNENLIVIALDFEKITDTTHAYRNIRRLRERFDIKYPILFAGSSDKKEAVKVLPVLEKIHAYPTLLFLDKNKNIVRIHTGFNGPATGEEFEKFKKEFEEKIILITN